MIITLYSLAEKISDLIVTEERYDVSRNKCDSDLLRLQRRELRDLLGQIKAQAEKTNQVIREWNEGML